MEAKDTVMDINARSGFNTIDNICAFQAEISFKAGIEEAFSRYKESPEYLLNLMKAKQDGRKEVVDWVETNSHNIFGILLPSEHKKDVWQAQVKKWEKE